MPSSQVLNGFLAREGIASSLIRSIDWAQTPAGAIESWPSQLKFIVGVMTRSSHPMMLWWGEHQLQFYNDAGIESGAVKHPESMGQRGPAYWPRSWPRIGQQVRNVLNNGTPEWLVDQQVSLVRGGKLAETYWTYEFSPVVDDWGGVLGTLIVFDEVTERVLAERQQHALRRIIDTVPARIAYFDADLVCRFTNHGFAEWVGKRMDSVLNRTAEELFGIDKLNAVRHHIDGALVGIPQAFETQWRLADGSIVFNHVAYAPESSIDGSSRGGVYVMGYDITALKLAQERLRALNRELASSRDEARRANRAKSAFLANMSHEIRTPMNAIIGLTHLLARETLDGQQAERIDSVSVAAKHLLGLIDSILDLSKIEAGKLVLDTVDFSTAAMLDAVVGMVADQAEKKGLQLRVESAGLPTRLRGDRLRLSQIVINLLSNAVKFTEVGTVVLRVQVIESVDDRVCLQFEVQDTGPGIALEHQVLLFSAFQQADSSMSRQHGGTGLGLALSRELARAMGGEASVTSEPGVGSTFKFTAWMKRREESTQGQTGRGSSEPGAPGCTAAMAVAEDELRAHYAGRRVLLAEDNPINRQVAEALLRSAGLAVESATDGAQAVKMAEGVGFDIVLMDMQMPKVDGLQAARALRAAGHRMPIIAMTANAFAEDKLACLEAGMDDHVTKPVEPTALYDMLLQWLAVKR